MNDLKQMLESSAERPPGLGLDPTDLLRRGKGRVRRRRAIAGSCALALAGVVAVGATWHHHGDDRTLVTDHNGQNIDASSAYIEQRISPEEVLKRCTPILDAQWKAPQDGWLEVPSNDGTPDGKTTETRVGFDATFVPKNKVGRRHAMNWSGDCLIPQEGRTDDVVAHLSDTPPPRPITLQCSTNARTRRDTT